MPKTSFKELLDAGVHFGHLKRKWNPSMAPYIFMEKNGIHIIDLNKTEAKLEEAANGLKQIAKSGRKILFVATKKQAKDIVSEKVSTINMPYVTERWPGGMLTNFPTIRKAVKKMGAIDKMAVDGTFDTLSKRERLQITRQRAKLEKMLGSISDLTRLPAAMFIVDVAKEYIAVREANRLNIPVFAMVDTNSDPKNIDFPIPANDDASKSISLILEYITEAVREGLNERKLEKDKEVAMAKEKKEKKEAAEKASKDEASAEATTDKKETKTTAKNRGESERSGVRRSQSELGEAKSRTKSAAKVEKPAASTSEASTKDGEVKAASTSEASAKDDEPSKASAKDGEAK